MSLTHSPEMHKNLIARIPIVTGRELREWFHRLESGPAFSRCQERAHWLAEVAGMYAGRAAETDRWLRGMNRLQQGLEAAQ